MMAAAIAVELMAKLAAELVAAGNANLVVPDTIIIGVCRDVEARFSPCHVVEHRSSVP